MLKDLLFKNPKYNNQYLLGYALIISVCDENIDMQIRHKVDITLVGNSSPMFESGHNKVKNNLNHI